MTDMILRVYHIRHECILAPIRHAKGPVRISHASRPITLFLMAPSINIKLLEQQKWGGSHSGGQLSAHTAKNKALSPKGADRRTLLAGSSAHGAGCGGRRTHGGEKGHVVN